MGILADMDYALDHGRDLAGKRKEFRLSKSAMHAFHAQIDKGNSTVHRGVPVVPNDWDTGWEN